MSGNRVQWIVLAIVVVALAVIGVLLGTNLVGSREAAVERGTVAGWWIVWVVIALNTLMALAVAAFLFAAGLGKVPETAVGTSR
jgi:uncharacterized membrane protein